MDLVVARFLPNGALDPAFASSGIVRIDLPGFLPPQSMEVRLEASGRITVATGGIMLPGGEAVVVARFLEDGELDQSFGQGGMITSPFFSSRDGRVSGVAIDTRPQSAVPASFGAFSPGAHRVIAVGSFSLVGREWAVARYRFDGSLDPDFGTDGEVTTVFDEGTGRAKSVTVDTEGSIVTSGEFQPTVGAPRFAIARYLPNGSLDLSFADEGVAQTSFPAGGALANAIVVSGTRQSVVVGRSKTGIERGFALARYELGGNLDPAFGENGKVHTDFDEGGAEARAVILDPKDRVIAVGTAGSKLAVARYGLDGRLDPGFGAAGRLTVEFGPGHGEALAVTAGIDGELVAVGEANQQLCVVRLREDGDLDSSFSSDGKIRRTISPSQFSRALAVAIDDARRTVVAGLTFPLIQGAELKEYYELGNRPGS